MDRQFEFNSTLAEMAAALAAFRQSYPAFDQTGRLDELRAATDAKWTELKSGVNAAIDELKESYRKALSRLP